jgi:large subunit ribosomal protein L4
MPQISISALLKRISWLGGRSTLFVDDVFDKNFQLSCANKFSINILPECGVNVYDLIKHDNLIITKSSLKKLEERLLLK